jgi:PAS domain S-box-containing protein
MDQDNLPQQSLLDDLKEKQQYIEELEALLTEKTQHAIKQNGLISIQLSDTCQQLVHAIQQRVRADRVTLFLVDPQQEAIILSLISGSQSKISIDYVELMDGLSGQVLETETPILSQTPTDEIETTDLYTRRLENDAESLFVVPLFAYDGDNQHVVGTITVINRKHQAALTLDDIETVQSLIQATHIRLDTVHILQDAFQAQFDYKAQYHIDYNLSQGVCLISRQTLQVVHVNSRFEQLFGYTHQEVINKPSEFFPNDELIRLQPQTSQTSTQFDYWQSEIQNRHKNRHIVWCNVTVSVTDHPEYGKVWVCVYTDITQRKHQEQRYHHQEHLLDFVVDAVISGDTDFNILTWNKAAENMYGWTEKEVLGRSAPDLFKTEYFDEKTSQETKISYREHGFWRGEMIHYHKDGTPIPVRGISSAIRDESGEAVGVVTILRDITDELKAERVLKASEERYRIISELLSDYAYMDKIGKDEEWEYNWITTDAFMRVTGYHPNELESRFEIYHPDELERVKQDVTATQAGEETEGEYRIITKDGEHRWLYVRRHVLRDENQQIIGFYGAGQDITERKQAEQRLIEYNQEKERVNILQSFIQDASHDLKTPISTIYTSIYILNKVATTEKQLKQLDKLEFNVNRLAKLIEDMFDMSRLDLLQYLPLTFTDLSLSLNDIITVYRPLAAEKNIEIHSELQNSSLIAMINVEALTQAITNIIKNAIWFTPHNGQVTIQSYQDEQEIFIAIEDNGIGISEEELPHIFTRFYRGDKSRGTTRIASTGLGLSIVRKIIELHNGQIDVESKLGEGTRFIIRLPRPN